MKLEVDKDICIGCGACQAIAPDVFEINDDGLATAIANEAKANAATAVGTANDAKAIAETAIQDVANVANNGLILSKSADNKVSIDWDSNVVFVFNCGSATELVD